MVVKGNLQFCSKNLFQDAVGMIRKNMIAWSCIETKLRVPRNIHYLSSTLKVEDDW